MRWSQVDRDAALWEIPAHLAKNGKPNTVPLSPFALRALDTMPRFENCDLVFSTNRRTPISGFSKMLRRISEASGTSDWRLHDIRRTAASGMARAGVAPHVVEKVLNHISGEISGVAAVYNRYGLYRREARGVECWGRCLMMSHDDRRYIPLRDAAAIIGPRFHTDWTDSDVDALAGDRNDDPEAFDRASHAQTLLESWIVDGDIKAFQDAPPDGSGRAVIDIPPQWYEAASFTICIRTSCFMVFTDALQPAYLKRASIVAQLPKVAGERQAGRYHAKDVVHAAWKLALVDPDGLTKAELTRRLVDWLARLNLYPDPTTLEDITGEVVVFLRENKTEPRVSESLPSCDPPSNST